MPRNSQGVYTLPAGNPVVPGTLIETTWANPTMADIADALTASLPRDGSAPMTGPLTLQAAAPTQPRHAVSKGYLETFLAYATGMPIGSLLPLAGSAIPSGFLLCDGQAVSRTTYPDLFASIGTIYGSGDGATTFNVPDLRDWFIRGRADARAIGSQQAAAFASHLHAVSDPGHAHVGSQAGHAHGVTVAAHGHTVNDPGHAHSANASLADSGSSFYSHNSAAPASTVNTNVAATGVTINNAPQLPGSTDAQQPAVTVAPDITGVTVGATGGDETRPQNVAMNYVIKAVNDALGPTALTGIISSDENVVGVDLTNPVVPELVIKTNVAFGGVKLDAAGKVPLQQMPFANSNLLGFFDASGGQNPTEAFPSTTFVNGDEFIVSVAGTINVFNPVTETSAPTLVDVGSTLLYITGSVSSPTGWYTIVAAAATNASAVSFLPEGTIGATNVQSAIAELDTETQTALGGKAPSSAATATGTSFTPTGNILASNVQAALVELDSEKVDVSALIAANVAYAPFGGVAANNVQEAINELDTEKAPNSATVGPAFAAFQIGGQTFTSTVASKINNAGEFFDTNSRYDAPNSRFTPNVEGYYQVNLTVTVTASTALAVLGAYVRKNGVAPAELAAFSAIPAATLNGAVNVSGLVYLNGTTDYIEPWVIATGTGTLSANTTQNSFSASLARRVG